MATANDAWEVTGAFVFMVACIVGAVAVSMILGTTFDQLYTGFIDNGINGGADTDWDVTGNIFQMINIFYLIPIGMAIVGIVTFFLTIVRKSRRDTIQYYNY